MAYDKAYYQKNREKRIAQVRESQKANPKAQAERSEAYRKRNPEKHAARIRAYRAKVKTCK